MVLIWGNLSRGNDSHTLVMVALNSVVMTLLFGVLGGFLLGVGRLPVPWEALLLSVAVYVISPLLCGYFSRQWILKKKGEILNYGSLFLGERVGLDSVFSGFLNNTELFFNVNVFSLI